MPDKPKPSENKQMKPLEKGEFIHVPVTLCKMLPGNKVEPSTVNPYIIHALKAHNIARRSLCDKSLPLWKNRTLASYSPERTKTPVPINKIIMIPKEGAVT